MAAERSCNYLIGLCVNKQLSDFLSTQLNTQSTLINLTDQISKNGLLEAKKIKEYFQNIEKEIKKNKK